MRYNSLREEVIKAAAAIFTILRSRDTIKTDFAYILLTCCMNLPSQS